MQNMELSSHTERYMMGKITHTSGRIWAIILAAGESRRMGRPKLLIPFDEKAVIETVVSNTSFLLKVYCAGRVGAKRRIETKCVIGEHRSLGFDTLRYSTGVRSHSEYC